MFVPVSISLGKQSAQSFGGHAEAERCPTPVQQIAERALDAATTSVPSSTGTPAIPHEQSPAENSVNADMLASRTVTQPPVHFHEGMYDLLGEFSPWNTSSCNSVYQCTAS